jgi:hypothetical protein
MDHEEFALIVENLEKVELLDLETTLAPAKPTLYVLNESERRYGEPGTIMIIMLAGSLALPAVLLWLARHRKGFDYSEKKNVTLPDGTEVTSLVKLRATESGPPSPAAIQQLKGLLDVDLTGALRAFEQENTSAAQD